MEHSVDFEMAFGAPEALHCRQKNNFCLLASYNTTENLWLSDPINKNYYQPRVQTDYPAAGGRSLTQDSERLFRIMNMAN